MAPEDAQVKRVTDDKKDGRGGSQDVHDAFKYSLWSGINKTSKGGNSGCFTQKKRFQWVIDTSIADAHDWHTEHCVKQGGHWRKYKFPSWRACDPPGRMHARQWNPSAWSWNAECDFDEFDACNNHKEATKYGTEFCKAVRDNGENYRTAVLGNNNKIYCAPYNGTHCLVFDIGTHNITLHKVPDRSFVVHKYHTLVKADNGNLYAVPYNARKVLKIIPSADGDTCELIGDVLGPDDKSQLKYMTSVLAGNGKIYAAPYGNDGSATKVLEIDPTVSPATAKLINVNGLALKHPFANHVSDTPEAGIPPMAHTNRPFETFQSWIIPADRTAKRVIIIGFIRGIRILVIYYETRMGLRPPIRLRTSVFTVNIAARIHNHRLT